MVSLDWRSVDVPDARALAVHLDEVQRVRRPCRFDVQHRLRDDLTVVRLRHARRRAIPIGDRQTEARLDAPKPSYDNSWTDAYAHGGRSLDHRQERSPRALTPGCHRGTRHAKHGTLDLGADNFCLFS